MAKTIISTGEKPHLPETTNRKDLLLRRIGGAVTGLVSRFKNLYPGVSDSSVNFDAAGGDTDTTNPEVGKEILDEETLKRIKAIDDNWEFRADVDGFNGNFIPKNYPDFAGSITSGNYEKIEKLVPDVRELLANDDRLNSESEHYEGYFHYFTHSFLLNLAKKNVAAFFKEHYRHMPKLMDSARRAMREQIDLIRSLKGGGGSGGYYEHESAVLKLMSIEAALPREIAEEFKNGIVNEVAEATEADADSMGWHRFDMYAARLADYGFPPERWPQDARDRDDFPEPLRRLVNEQGDKEKGLDRAIIKYCIEKTEIYGDDGKMKPDVSERCDLIQKYFEGRLPELDREMIFCGVSSMVTLYSSRSMYLQTERYNDYIQTIRGIGQ